MLAHRLRRWANIKPALVQGFVLAGSHFLSSVAALSKQQSSIIIPDPPYA